MPESKAACPKSMAARPSQRLHARNRGRGFIPKNKGSADSCLGIGRHLHDQYLRPGEIVVYNSACPQAHPRLRPAALKFGGNCGLQRFLLPENVLDCPKGAGAPPAAARRRLQIAAALASVRRVLCDTCGGRQAQRIGVGSSRAVSWTMAPMRSWRSIPWCAQPRVQHPPRLSLLGQAVSSVGGLIMQWTEHYTSAFPNLARSNHSPSGRRFGPEQDHAVLVASPVNTLTA